VAQAVPPQQAVLDLVVVVVVVVARDLLVAPDQWIQYGHRLATVLPQDQEAAQVQDLDLLTVVQLLCMAAARQVIT
jgi:hypothetical protein